MNKNSRSLESKSQRSKDDNISCQVSKTLVKLFLKSSGPFPPIVGGSKVNLPLTEDTVMVVLELNECDCWDLEAVSWLVWW